MTSFPWVPLDTIIDDSVQSGKILLEGDKYQILDTRNGDKVILLIKDNASWLKKVGKGKTQEEMLVGAGLIKSYRFDDEDFRLLVVDKRQAPVPVSNLIGPVGTNTEKITSLSSALLEMNSLFPDAVFDTALFIESENVCIVTQFDRTLSTIPNKKKLAIRLLVGAVKDTEISIQMMRKLNPKLTTSQIREFFSALGIEDQSISLVLDKCTVKSPSKFTLPGRPELEQFFRDNVIDYFHSYKKYRVMDIAPPNGVLLYGPPGTGKTYSVRKLAEFLGWSLFDIDIGSVGSPYIHQTSKTLNEIFNKASDSAPSIVLMEEIDALAGSRSAYMHDHKIEEISQILRLIETASKNGILVIGTTNRFDSMDEAIIRRGRFDHIFELGFPSKAEIISAVSNLLKTKPIEDGLDLEEYSEKLCGYPMSDIAWSINEAAKYAVKNDKDKIDRECLLHAANLVLVSPRKH